MLNFLGRDRGNVIGRFCMFICLGQLSKKLRIFFFMKFTHARTDVRLSSVLGVQSIAIDTSVCLSVCLLVFKTRRCYDRLAPLVRITELMALRSAVDLLVHRGLLGSVSDYLALELFPASSVDARRHER